MRVHFWYLHWAQTEKPYRVSPPIQNPSIVNYSIFMNYHYRHRHRIPFKYYEGKTLTFPFRSSYLVNWIELKKKKLLCFWCEHVLERSSLNELGTSSVHGRTVNQYSFPFNILALINTYIIQQSWFHFSRRTYFIIANNFIGSKLIYFPDKRPPAETGTASAPGKHSLRLNNNSHFSL